MPQRYYVQARNLSTGSWLGWISGSGSEWITLTGKLTDTPAQPGQTPVWINQGLLQGIDGEGNVCSLGGYRSDGNRAGWHAGTDGYQVTMDGRGIIRDFKNRVLSLWGSSNLTWADDETQAVSFKFALAYNDLPDDPHWERDFAEAEANVNYFAEPADRVKYTDYRYVGTHNSFSYPRFFQTVRQQDQTIIGHLTLGVRGLMLDTYDWNNLPEPEKRRGPGTVVLSHGEPGGAQARVQKGHGSYQTLMYELRRVVEFLKINPASIVSIFLEDYASRSTTETEIKQVLVDAGLRADELILRPVDIGGQFQGRDWLTLGWMRQQNRRLVIFTQSQGNTSVTFDQFANCFENGYGDLDPFSERPESRGKGNDRQLVLFNNFPGPAGGSGVTLPVVVLEPRVERDEAKRMIQKAQTLGFAGGRLFNGYWADRVVDCTYDLAGHVIPSVFDYVNALNAVAAPTPVMANAHG